MLIFNLGGVDVDAVGLEAFALLDDVAALGGAHEVEQAGEVLGLAVIHTVVTLVDLVAGRDDGLVRALGIGLGIGLAQGLSHQCDGAVVAVGVVDGAVDQELLLDFDVVVDGGCGFVIVAARGECRQRQDKEQGEQQAAPLDVRMRFHVMDVLLLWLMG